MLDLVDEETDMGLRELAEDARRLGHGGIDVQPTVSGRRWQISCSCGWGAPMKDGSGRPTVTAATETEAIARALWHIRSEVKKAEQLARSSGVSFQAIVGGSH